MFVSWRTHRASTGPLEYRFDFTCAHCGTQAPAVVRTEGHGSHTTLYGGSGGAEGARAAAVHSAHGSAARAMEQAVCPRCRKLPPAAVERFDSARRLVDERRRQRLPTAARAAAIALALGAIPAAIDLRTSSMLCVVAVALAVLVGAIAFINKASVPALPQIERPLELWFWWDAHPYQAAWTRAPEPIDIPAPIKTSSVPVVLGGLALAVSLLVGTIALVEWRQTFLDIYVVDIHPGGTRILVDGKEEGTTKLVPRHDAAFETATVRRGKSHNVTLVDASGKSKTFELGDLAAKHTGWVIAVEPHANDLCLFDEESIYYAGISKATVPDIVFLNKEPIEIMKVEHRFDHVLQPGPSSVQLSKGETEARHRLLRAYKCSTLRRSAPVPYRGR